MKRQKFPVLSKIVQTYLCVQATFVASERIFSDASNILTKTRNRLNPDKVNTLICIHKNVD